MSVESVLARVAALEQAIANPSALLGVNAAGTGGTAAPVAAEPPTSGSGSFAQALRSASAGYEGEAGTAGADTPATTYTAPDTTLSPSAAMSSAGPTGSASYPLAAAGTGTVASAAGSGTVASAAQAMGTEGADTLASGSPSYPSTGALEPTLGATSTIGETGGGTGAQIARIAESQIGQAEQPLGSNESPAIAMYRTATAGAIPGAPWCAYFASWAARQAGEPLGAHGEGLGSVGQIWSWAQSTGRAIPNGPGVTPQPGDLIVFGDEHVGIVRDVLPNGDIQTIEGNYENKVSANVRTPTEATGYVNMN
jgi:hypothetical protein